MHSYKIPILLTCLATLHGCQTPSGSTSPSFGGTGIRASALDGLRAGPLSKSLGEGLGRSTLTKALNAEMVALETGLAGSATNWREGDVSGKVIPGQVYEVGSYKCRRYTHQIVVAGNARKSEGTACKGENGLWTALD